jgi:Alginate lyase.
MKKIYLIALAIFCITSGVKSQWMWDINIMREIKKNIKDTAYTAAYDNLIRDAERRLDVKPYSVTYKEGVAPSGDNRDYVSLSRYVWPDPSKPDGLPYIHRDGVSNPELEKYDRNPLGNMASAVNALCLAYFFSNDERYATKAVDFLKTWFLDEKTGMNPHLEYAQFIPGVNNNKGRQYGLIDTYSFVDMLNSIKLLETSASYTKEVDEGLKKWFKQLSMWWQTSEQGIAEKRGSNNHGLAYDVQLVMFALFADDKETALKVIDEYPKTRIYKQIQPDGAQPEELRRTLAFHYSQYNISHMVDMAAIAKSIGIDLLTAKSEDGRSLFKAVDFLTPYLGKDVSEWPYQQISGWPGSQLALCEDIYRIVIIDPSLKDYSEIYKKFGRKSPSDRKRLIYGVKAF